MAQSPPPDPEPDVRPAPAGRGRRKRAATAVTVLSCLYLAALLGLWLVLCAAADRWWPATVLMYSPRWVWGLPLAALLPAAALARRRRAWYALAIGTLVLLFPVMRLCVPWQRLLPKSSGNAPHASRTLRVVTLNGDDVDLDAAAFRKWIDETRPDVVALQAWSSRHQGTVFGTSHAQGGWHMHRDGELFVASRHPITPRPEGHLPAWSEGGSIASYEIHTPGGIVRLFNLHLSTPRHALLAVARQGRGAAKQVTDNSAVRLAQSEAARERVDRAIAEGAPVLIAGDLNTPTDGAGYRRCWSDFTNAFSAGGFGFGNTHFTRHTAVRIDHILAGPRLRIRRAWVGPYVGSGHRPLVADVEFPATGR